MTVLALLPNGKVIARVAITAASRTTAGAIPLAVTVVDVGKVEAVLGWDIRTSPQTNWSPVSVDLSKNVVGATIYVAAGTTVSGYVLVIGY